MQKIFQKLDRGVFNSMYLILNNPNNKIVVEINREIVYLSHKVAKRKLKDKKNV
jgi:hypothetical protein